MRSVAGGFALILPPTRSSPTNHWPGPRRRENAPVIVGSAVRIRQSAQATGHQLRERRFLDRHADHLTTCLRVEQQVVPVVGSTAALMFRQSCRQCRRAFPAPIRPDLRVARRSAIAAACWMWATVPRRVAWMASWYGCT